MAAIGVIGLGMVSRLAHLPAIAQVPGLELRAVADLQAGLAQRLAAGLGGVAAYAGHRELLQSDVEAVVVVTHRRCTAPIVRDALLAGKHVLSEKPMAMTLEEARELAALAAERRLVYGVGFMKRYDAGVARARRLLDELREQPALGRLIQVRGKNFCAEYVGHCGEAAPGGHRPVLPELPAWLDSRYDWFANVGLHSLNLLRFLLPGGLALRHADFSYADCASLLFDAGGVPVSLDVGKAATGRWEESFEFFFERGRLELELTSLKQRDRCAAVRLDDNAGDPKSSSWGHDASGPWCFIRQMQAFAEALAGKPQALLTPAGDCLRDMQLLDEIFHHAKE